MDKPVESIRADVEYEKKRYKIHCELQTAYEELSFDSILVSILAIEQLSISEGKRLAKAEIVGIIEERLRYIVKRQNEIQNDHYRSVMGYKREELEELNKRISSKEDKTNG